MAGTFNRATLMGNVGGDPEVKSFQNGGKIATLRLATTQVWKDRNTDEKHEKTEWSTVVFRGENLVQIVEGHVKKGAKILVEGMVATRKWQDQAGTDRYATEVVVNQVTGSLTLLPAVGGSSNEVTIIGNLGRDPEVRSFQNGGKVANLRIATSEKWTDRNTGEAREATEWHSVSLRGGVAGVAEAHLKKGDMVMVKGLLETRSWEQDGTTRYATEIVVAGTDGKLVLMGGKKSDETAAGQEEAPAPTEDEIPY